MRLPYKGDLHARMAFCTLEEPICVLWKSSAHVWEEIDMLSEGICRLSEAASSI